MKILRLPTVIRIEVASYECFSGWSALASIYDQKDAAFEALQPLPRVERVTREDAERAAFHQLRDWINLAWPRRTVPNPV